MRLFSSGKRERETKEAGRLGRQSERCGDSWSAVTFYAERQRYAAIAFPYWTRCIYLFWSSLFFSSNQGSVFTSFFFFGRCRSTASISLLKRPAKLAIVCKVSVAAARHLSPSLNSSSSLFITRTPLRFAFIAAGPPYVQSCERDSGAKQKRGDLRNMSPN